MTARLRLALLVARPAVVFLLGLSGLVGLALGGAANDVWAVGRLLVLVTAFVVYAVSCNDLSDLEVDRVNLAGDVRRPLVTGSAGPATSASWQLVPPSWRPWRLRPRACSLSA